MCHSHGRNGSTHKTCARVPIDPNCCGQTQHNLQQPAPADSVLNSVGKTRWIWSLLNFLAAARQDKEVSLRGRFQCANKLKGFVHTKVGNAKGKKINCVSAQAEQHVICRHQKVLRCRTPPSLPNPHRQSHLHNQSLLFTLARQRSRHSDHLTSIHAAASDHFR